MRHFIKCVTLKRCSSIEKLNKNNKICYICNVYVTSIYLILSSMRKIFFFSDAFIISIVIYFSLISTKNSVTVTYKLLTLTSVAEVVRRKISLFLYAQLSTRVIRFLFAQLMKSQIRALISLRFHIFLELPRVILVTSANE